MIKLLEYKEDLLDKKIVECNNLSNDIIFRKYDIQKDDIIKIKENQFVVIAEKGRVLDIKECSGIFCLQNIDKLDEEFEKEWGNLIIRKSEDTNLCAIFLNINVINHNKYLINDPIKYLDWKNDKASEIYIKLEGYYDFKIENPKMLLSKIIGLRNHFSKQELIEKVRKFILNSIQDGINEISKEYKLDINTLTEKSKELEVKLRTNEYDLKLLEYGVKLTYFDIEKFEVTKKKFKIFSK